MVLGGVHQRSLSRCTDLIGAKDDPFAASGSDGGQRGRGRPAKKQKEKKMPQRGLGVAQLERMRIEEQRRNGAETCSSSSAMKFPPMTHPNRSSVKVAPGPCSSPHAIAMAHTLPSEERFPSLRNYLNINSAEAEPAISPENEIWASVRPPSRDPLRKNRLPYSLEKFSLPPLLSGGSLQMEPPSNQNSGSNPDHGKIRSFGAKRRRFLSLHNHQENDSALFKSSNSVFSSSSSAASYSTAMPSKFLVSPKQGTSYYSESENEAPPFFTFFPSKEDDRQGASQDKSHGETLDHLDLNLKL